MVVCICLNCYCLTWTLLSCCQNLYRRAEAHGSPSGEFGISASAVLLRHGSDDVLPVSPTLVVIAVLLADCQTIASARL